MRQVLKPQRQFKLGDMEKDTDSSRRLEKRKSFNRERSITNEQRFDSLQSLSRLVENDLKTEIETSRRVSLPALDGSFLSSELKTGAWRRNSSIVEYMQELTTKRQGMIQRLMPDVQDQENCNCHEDKDFNTTHINDKHGESGDQEKSDDKINDQESVPLKNDSVFKSPKFESCNDLDVEESVKILREKIAKFESMKNASRSIHADGFQQFLGERYLEIYQKRVKRITETGKFLESSMHKTDNKPRVNEKLENFQGRNSRSLNVKIHSMAKKHQSYKRVRNGSSQKVILPAVFKGSDTGKKDSADRTKSTLELNSKYGQGIFPIRNDLVGGNFNRRHTKGIPHHSENRAQKRFQDSREINTILNELRRLSSTVQKSEQEHFINKLEEDTQR